LGSAEIAISEYTFSQKAGPDFRWAKTAILKATINEARAGEITSIKVGRSENAVL
jgi:hypothetical protein